MKRPFDFDHLERTHRGPEAVDICKRLLYKNPDHRLTIDEAVHHSLFRMKGHDQFILDMMPIVLKNFRGYRSKGNLQLAILTYFVRNLLTEVEEDLYKEMFFLINKSMTGGIDRREILEEFWFWGIKDISMYDVDQLFSLLDGSNSGTINFWEFLMAALNPTKLMSRERITRCFHLMDVDQTGSLSI